MKRNTFSKRDEPLSRVLVWALMGAIFVRILIAVNTYGTNDAAMWDSSAQRIMSHGWLGIYGELVRVNGPDGTFLHYQVFNHPPLMILILRLLGALESLTHIPPSMAIRLLNSAADAGTCLLFYKTLVESNPKVSIIRIVVMVFSPVWISISAFHSNSDPLMIFLLMLSIYQLEVSNDYVCASLALSFSSGIKIAPLLLLPAFLVSLSTYQRRLRFTFVILVFWLLSAGPWILTDILPLVRNIFGYGSLPGHWGITFIARLNGPDLALLGDIYESHGKLMVISTILAATWYLHRLPQRPSLIFQSGFVFLIFLATAPGFGIQYLVWLYPWIALSSTSMFMVSVVSTSFFVLVVYTFWSGGFPWYFANSIVTGTWNDGIGGLGLGAWLAILATLIQWVRYTTKREYPTAGQYRVEKG